MLTAIGILTGCSAERAAPSQSERLSSKSLASPSPADGPLFAALTAERSGLAFENPFGWGSEREHLYTHGWAGGGVCIGDVNGDDLPDLFLTSQTGRDRLFRNLGGLRFEDVTDVSGLPEEQDWGAGACFVDIEGDGDLDLYLCNYDAPNRLYLNRGDGHFEEAARAAGLDYSGASVKASFADVDRDGDLDLFLLTNRLYPGPGRDDPRTEHVEGRVRLVPGQEDAFALQERNIDGRVEKYVVKAGERDRLFRNEGQGRFRDVTDEAGLDGHHPGLDATWWDYDQDGWPDLYVCNDFWDPDRLWHNRGDGTFEDRASEVLPHTPWFSMGADAADVDGDGRLDLLVADMAPTTHVKSKIMMGEMGDSRWFLESAEPRQYMRNALYLPTGTGRCLEASWLAGLSSTDWTWSVLFGDLDCDGWSDLFVTTGSANHSFDPDLNREMAALARRPDLRASKDPLALRKAQWELYRSRPPRTEANLAFRNAGDLEFARAREWGLEHEDVAFGAALADLDRDGDLDLVVNPVGQPARIHENRAAGEHRLLLRLVARGDPWGIGSRVTVETAEGRQVRELQSGAGYMSANEPLLHFGLGQAERIDRLLVRWPSGLTTVFEGLDADRSYVLCEDETAVRMSEEVVPTLFREASAELGLEDTATIEKPYDDYAREELLPQALSRPGPGLAVADVDGDGDDDLWMGGAAGVAGRLFLWDAGRFHDVPQPAVGALYADRHSEDTMGLFFDADSDGDFDLFVASGSVEGPERDPRRRDRLYWNDGQGRFERAAPEVLPEATHNTGTAALGDVDGDGDLDLFLGSRSIPGAYPRTPRSRLLLNEQGHFRDVTDELAPGLSEVGLVTAALFVDLDGDRHCELVVACEWGPVSVWSRVEEAWVDRTLQSGLAEDLGWWNGLAAGDFDRDGRIDLVALNAGENTKYHPTEEQPARLYLGEFEEGGRPQLVEAKCESETELPVRGLSCSSHAMPSIRERLPTFEAFARSILPEIYPAEALEGALLVEANSLASVLLLNRSTLQDGLRFETVELPRSAQTSIGQGAVTGDFDADGELDLFFGQNYFWREPETGRWDGGLGVHLEGSEDGLRAVPHARSGLVVPGEARGVLLADLDADARPEILVARQGESLLAFRLTAGDRGQKSRVALRLAGPPGNPAGVGARVEVETPAGRRSTQVMLGGSGKLSQSAPVLFLCAPPGSLIEVTWPDGEQSESEVEEPGAIVVAYPEQR